MSSIALLRMPPRTTDIPRSLHLLQRLAGQQPIETPFTRLLDQARPPQPAKATALSAFLGAAQAGLIACGLWIFTTKVQGLVEASNLPDQYTARNIAITVRTMIVGLLYLVTFIFSANTLGLAGGLCRNPTSCQGKPLVNCPQQP